MNKDCEITISSAPGKALIVGGYLVLDRNYNGLVVSLNSRVYVAIKSQPLQNKSQKQFNIIVDSFQFLNACWQYTVSKEELGNGDFVPVLKQIQAEGSTKNKFIQTVLDSSLKLIKHRNPLLLKEYFYSGTNLEIVIASDNEFYSASEESLNENMKFKSTNSTLENVHKTGLGSSAALVTALCASLLLHFKVVSKDSFKKELYVNQTFGKERQDLDLSNVKRDREILDFLSQYAHCTAQGKIGSGFDISAAIFGTQIYRRFTAEDLVPKPDMNESDFLLEFVNGSKKLDSEATSVCIPPLFTLMLADVNAGSNTPSMVKKVLEWRKNDPNNLNLSIYKIRKCLKKIGELAGVPIEPDEQSKLIDSCIEIPGVIMAGVPGAGGYDAIFCLILTKEPIQELKKLFKMEFTNVNDLGCHQDDQGCLYVDQNESYVSELLMKFSKLS
ncbi:hypothetical protein BB560_001630 [Smittium megazygosporum]|uniref:Phosphomevalonate kinase n=1 Tax=Smittium megazygosporum TaxID=133381 RepID=A0A2T9ZH83_9FUNG|nr:hypothetical protein BB560_001630 [Smittium megazygosporum]